MFVRGNCGALTEVVSTNGGFASQVTFTVDGSNTYYIIAEPLNDGPGGNFVLNVSASNVPITLTPRASTLAPRPSDFQWCQTVTYLNGTPGPVTVTNVTITSVTGIPGSNDFTIVSQTCQGSVVPSGINCAVAVVFNPQPGAVGLRQANLIFMDTATGSPRIVPLSGTGTPAVPVLLPEFGQQHV